jgi:DNA-binding CsgD family transcriptional regulator
MDEASKKKFPPLLPDDIWSKLAAKHGWTAREEEVMALICRGAGYVEIGDMLSISRPTVRAHIRAAYAKCGCKNRVVLILSIVHEYFRPRHHPRRSSP